MAAPDAKRLVLLPLPDFVHFPRTDLRLAFSVQDRKLLEPILGAEYDDEDLIGTVLLKPAWARESGRSTVFPAGTACRILEHEAQTDGTLHLLVRGEYRFEVAREVGEGPVREALVRPLHEPYCSDVDPGVMALRDQLSAAVDTLVRGRDAGLPLDADQLASLGDGVSFEVFVNSVASTLDLSPLRKLSLLADTLPERAENLVAILRSRETLLGLLRPYRHLASNAEIN